MPRKKCIRHIHGKPEITCYKPAGIPMRLMDEVILQLDEFEALRLADLECFYQADAAEKMNVSRQTFGRIIESAHKKIADALINGKAIRFEEGNVETKQK